MHMDNGNKRRRCEPAAATRAAASQENSAADQGTEMQQLAPDPPNYRCPAGFELVNERFILRKRLGKGSYG